MGTFEKGEKVRFTFDEQPMEGFAGRTHSHGPPEQRGFHPSLHGQKERTSGDVLRHRPMHRLHHGRGWQAQRADLCGTAPGGYVHRNAARPWTGAASGEMMRRCELVCVGAGPAGLSAAIEAARCGVEVVVFDENERPGGQLFKQIHKFFGSKEHRAQERGFHIGQSLLDEARQFGVEVVLKAVVLGIYENRTMNVMIQDRIEEVKAERILVATGASENMIPFPGWTLPGVIGAGAAQTMANIHGVRPGNNILMVGSGNVGVVVSFQLLQAGCRIAAVIDAAPRISGYGVHSAKVARYGVPFFLSHTIKEARGSDRVTGATIVEVDSNWQPVSGTEKTLEVDTICIAVGLNPMTQLLRMAGCKMASLPALGGNVPVHDLDQQTSLPGIYVAGDVSGIEEASTAIIEGRIAGLAAAHSLGYLETAAFEQQRAEQLESMSGLRSGPYGEARRQNKEQLYAMMEG